LLFDYEDDNEIEHVNNQTKDNTNIWDSYANHL
jgi:hypothetical protein